MLAMVGWVAGSSMTARWVQVIKSIEVAKWQTSSLW